MADDDFEFDFEEAPEYAEQAAAPVQTAVPSGGASLPSGTVAGLKGAGIPLNIPTNKKNFRMARSRPSTVQDRDPCTWSPCIQRGRPHASLHARAAI